MTPQQFENEVKKKAASIKKALEIDLPHTAGKQAVRFVIGNFQAQGWQGRSFQAWKPNKRKGRILVETGKLRKDTTFKTIKGGVILQNSVPYAKINNEGGSIRKNVSVRSFSRKRNGKSETVSAHRRTMNTTIPRRQFFPTTSSSSPVLNKAIARTIKQAINAILK